MQVYGFRKGLEHVGEPFRTALRLLLGALLRLVDGRLVSLVVYGSVARGDARPDSDIDVLVVVEGLPRGRLRRLMLFEKAEEMIERELEELRRKTGYALDFSPILLTPEEASRHRPIYLDMTVDAVIVYDRNGFMERVLGEVARRLRELGAERVWLGRRWYWRLKRDYKPGEVIEV